MNLLETAGFSRANPYYVVQQGKVGSCSSISTWTAQVFNHNAECAASGAVHACTRLVVPTLTSGRVHGKTGTVGGTRTQLSKLNVLTAAGFRHPKHPKHPKMCVSPCKHRSRR